MKNLLAALFLLVACNTSNPQTCTSGIVTMTRIDGYTAHIEATGGNTFSIDVVTTDGAPFVISSPVDLEWIEMLDGAHYRLHFVACVATAGDIMLDAPAHSINILAFGA